MAQEGKILWLTGLSGAGKSTIAENLEKALEEKGVQSFILDGDKVRQGLNCDLGFSPEDREENIRRIGEVAKLFQMAGVYIIVAFISPYKGDREKARQKVEDGQFVEVFIDCPVEECQKRDPKGLYAKAVAGEIKEFTGISAPYEAPTNPEVHLKTSENTVDECITQVIDYLSI